MGIAGVSFSKTDAALGNPETAAVLEVLEGTGETDLLTYVLIWPNDPVAGDIVTFTYNAASGFYQDNLADPMVSTSAFITNCLGGPTPVINAWTTESGGDWGTESALPWTREAG